MKKFCVAFDLKGDKRDYTDLEDKLEELNGEWIQKSVWILEFYEDKKWTPQLLEDELIDYFWEGDKYLISELMDDYVLSD